MALLYLCLIIWMTHQDAGGIFAYKTSLSDNLLLQGLIVGHGYLWETVTAHGCWLVLGIPVLSSSSCLWCAILNVLLGGINSSC